MPVPSAETVPEQAVILCGGLRSDGSSTPMPRLADGRPLPALLMGELKRQGFRRVVLLAEKDQGAVAGIAGEAAASLGLDVAVVTGPRSAGSAGMLRQARPILDPAVLVLDGDSWFDVNWLDLACRATRRPADAATLALRHGAVGGLPVTCNGDRVTGVAPRRERLRAGARYGGVCVVRRDALDDVPPTGSFVSGLVSRWARESLVGGVVYDGFFRDLGSPETIPEARAAIEARLRRAAVFLDRDGVLNEDLGYVGTPERFRWCAEAVEAIKCFNDAGHLVFVVTNQSGVARGFYSEADVDALHRTLQDDLRRHGAHVDDVRYCPYHVDATVARYVRASSWRKPAPGMILDLLACWTVDRASSIVVGDRKSDLDAASAAGLRGHLVGPEGLTRDLARRIVAGEAP